MEARHRELAIALRHELHAHPELSMRESWTKNRLMEFLRDNTRLELVDCGRWFYAVCRAGADRPSLAFRADMDAVPVEEDPGLVPYASRCAGAAHKCGHDGHSAALAGFALELDASGADKNIYLVFQHAEEIGGGAAECVDTVKGLGVSEIYAVHTMPGLTRNAVSAPSGTAQFASTGMILRFEGAKSHACYPEDGRNPAFAISELVLALDRLRSEGCYRDMTLITVIAVQVGERAFGTGAGYGELLLTVRAARGDELADLLRRIEALAGEKAAQHGLALAVSYEDTFPDTWNHPAAAEKVCRAAQALGLRVEDLDEPFRASEDFGWFTKQIPGAMFYVGAGDCPPLHTAAFDFPDDTLETIVDLYGKLAAMPLPAACAGAPG